jgi:hypothetical protein
MVAPRKQDAALIRVTSAHAAAATSPLRLADPWVTTERHPVAPDQRLAVLPRFKYPQFRHPRSSAPRPLLRDAHRLVRRPSKLTLGAAAATAVVAAAVAAGVSAGSSTAPSQPNDIAQAQHAAAHSAKQAPGKPRAASAHTSHQSAPAANYLMYDSVLPSALPANQVVATYAAGGYAVPPSQVTGHKAVLWIDTTGSDYNASILDIEPGAAPLSSVEPWVWHRLHAHPQALARLYSSQAEWPAVQAAVATLPASMRSQIRWWIADPTGTPHLVPGSDATQWYWGSTYDLSTVTPRF